MANHGEISYRIPRKLFGILRRPDKNTFLTVQQVIQLLNETAGLRGTITILDIVD